MRIPQRPQVSPCYEGIIARLSRVGDFGGEPQRMRSNRGVGIVEERGGAKYFFEASGVDSDLADLHPGDPVRFSIEPGPLLRATHITKCVTDASVDLSKTADKPVKSIISPVLGDSIVDSHPCRQDAETAVVLQQTRVGHAALMHSQAALLVALDWPAGNRGSLRRQWVSVKEAFAAFVDRMVRTFAAEERDGLCTLATQETSTTSRPFAVVLREHGPLLKSMRTLEHRLRNFDVSDTVGWEQIQHDIRRAIMRVEEHLHREATLAMALYDVDISVVD